jgi:hypothetical protein
MAVWELGLPQNWAKFENTLAPFLHGMVWVMDKQSEVLVKKIATQIEQSKQDGSATAVHVMLDKGGGDNAELFKMVLMTGYDPDITSSMRWTAAHVCSAQLRIEAAKALAPCRPNLALKNTNNHYTPIEAASPTATYTVS